MALRLLYRLLCRWLRLASWFYFREVRVTGLHRLPKTGPVLFAANHQNSFLDAVLIATRVDRPIHFLVRSDVFRKPWARKVLHALNMMPVFRLRDGWNTLSRNAESFSRCTEIWMHGGAVLIFPEGNHSFQRRLRPLSRGFTKPLMQTLDRCPGIDIKVVPVGLNFTAHASARSGVHVIFGEVIAVQDHCTAGGLDANGLRNELAAAMRGLVTHIGDTDGYDSIIRTLEEKGADYMDPDTMNRRIAEIGSGQTPEPHPSWGPDGISSTVIRLVHHPVLFFWRRFIVLFRDPMFVGSVKFVFAAFVVPLYYALIGALLWWTLG